jgi:hypothetical protein
MFIFEGGKHAQAMYEYLQGEMVEPVPVGF